MAFVVDKRPKTTLSTWMALYGIQNVNSSSESYSTFKQWRQGAWHWNKKTKPTCVTKAPTSFKALKTTYEICFQFVIASW